jgi:hypothetical protein
MHKTKNKHFQGARYRLLIEKDGYAKNELSLTTTVNGWYFGNFFWRTHWPARRCPGSRRDVHTVSKKCQPGAGETVRQHKDEQGRFKLLLHILMKTKLWMQLVTSLTWVTGSLFLPGCASPASVRGMQPPSLTLQNQHPYSLSVQVVGGEATNPLLTSEISNESFAEAIRKGIADSGLFRSVIPAGNGDYLLEVALVNVAKPSVGFDMTVNLTASWKLIHVPNHKIVYQDVISQSYTATVGDAFAAVKRLRLAQEGAARGNIQTGLTRISRLKLQGNE